VSVFELLAIRIGMDPNIAEIGAFILTWHGVFTAVGIAAGILLAVKLAPRAGFTEDDGYTIALIAVPAGIVGARAMYVLENRVNFQGQWFDALRINEGGITIYGGIIFGVLAAVAWGLLKKMPVTRGLDVAIFGILLAMGIGRIGDLINGEHIGRPTSLPWGVEYTHPNSPSWQLGVTHPATTYEMIGDFLIIGALVFLFSRFFTLRPGIVFFSGVVLYSAMRFFVSYLRIDSCPTGPPCPDYVIGSMTLPGFLGGNTLRGLVFPQVVSIFTFAIGLAGLAWASLRKPQPLPDADPRATATGTQRKTAAARQT
jgi:phosphatidylglycerol---prolipoprotein diacylglyceryl transferase